MLRVGAIKVNVSSCIDGVYLRWWFNGWHYFNFINRYEIEMKSESMGTQVSRLFSVISKIERPTRLKAEYSYKITMEGITAMNVAGFTGLLMSEKVEQYEGGIWREVDLTRGEHLIRNAGENGYILDFELTRKELAAQSSVYQKFQKLYVGDTLCDLDDDEPIPINKQVNDIAELQDRQSDFTAQFKIRKTRAMKDLFELSGEVGVNTIFPYQRKSCKLVQDGIEIITNGNMILDRVDESYYYVAIYSGNLNLFSTIEELKITDLLLPTTNHTWTASIQATSNISNLDYVYPLCEPSDDGGMIPANTDPGNDRCELYGGWIWCFVKVKAIWDEIFVTSGYTVQGDILTDDKFLKLYMPITNLSISNIDIKPYLYTLHAINRKVMSGGINILNLVNATVQNVLGDTFWSLAGIYLTKFAATYKFRVVLRSAGGSFVLPVHVYVYSGGVQVAEMIDDGTYVPNVYLRAYTAEYYATALQSFDFRVTITGLAWYDLQVIDITDVRIDYLSTITPHLHLPDMTQTNFIKLICNLFGLVPEVNARDKIVKFWNYSVLYENIPNARDWSAYLSEREDEVEFKFGDYARQNYLRYKESEDVVRDRGTGIIQIDDDNLKLKKDVVQLEVSTTDEVTVLGDVDVSRINFNKYNEGTGDYDQQDSIDPRIVHVDYIKDPYTSPPYEKTFGIRTLKVGGTSYDSVTPKKASSIEIAFSTLQPYYASLANMLNNTELRRCKFNLPVYEVAGFNHDIPIYVSQYKAYFYVNKINNYVPGRLSIIEMIKL